MSAPCFLVTLLVTCLLGSGLSFLLVVEGQTTIAALLAMEGQWQRAPEVLATVALALLGGVVDYLQTSIDDGRFVLAHMLARVLVAVFAGIVVAELLSAADVPDRLRNAMVALAGYMGPRALKPLEARFNRWIGGRGDD